VNTHPRPYPRRLAGLLTALVALLTALALGSAPAPHAVAAPSAAPTAPSAPTAPVAVGGALERAGRVTYRLERHRYRVPFHTKHVRTDRLRRGQTRVAAPGRTGTWVKVYRVKRVDGRVVRRQLLRGFMARKPHTRVIQVGTRTATQGGGGQGGGDCNPNYRGACVPNASDVDCAGGSGNGPRYVQGPVYVVGNDVYDLDSDGDGVGCES
jgi:resuscitation-promoting factor RpfB